jgi:hypothetical protein
METLDRGVVPSPDPNKSKENDMHVWSARALQIAGLLLAFLVAPLVGSADDKPPGLGGMNLHALEELHEVGIDKYLGDFEPAVSEPSGDWVKHTFDEDGGDGPVCIDGSPVTVFTKERDPDKVVVFLNGGGACWQDFYFCTQQSSQDPPNEEGIFADSFDTGTETIDNPLADWSIMWVSQCDGSTYTGDNELVDANPTWEAISGTSVRRHRGHRNLSAALDLAADIWPGPKKLLLTGSSAGGAAVQANASFIARFLWPVSTKLLILDDGGPPPQNPNDPDIDVRASDWGQGMLYPASCEGCDPFGQPAAGLIDWRHQNDNQVREALYSTDGDQSIRFFLGFLGHEAFRNLLLGVTDPIVADHDRYKRFIPHGTSHTLLRGDSYYTQEANGVRFTDWVEDFVNHHPGWVDIVEDFVPAP